MKSLSNTVIYLLISPSQYLQKIITGYSPIENSLKLKTVMCGLIRHKNTGKCVTEFAEQDYSRYITLTDDCAGDRNIFCYDSVSRFIKLQDEEDACVTIESNNLVLRKCNEVNDNMKWVYTEDSLIRSTSSTTCWAFNTESNIMKVASRVGRYKIIDINYIYKMANFNYIL